MIKVFVLKQSNYPIPARKIRDCLRSFLEKKGIVSDSEVSVALVGEAKMRDLGRKYLKERKSDPVHSVLSFASAELKDGFVYPPDERMQLGEITVCYPVAVEESKTEGKLIEKKVIELVEHGALHLLGIHHS